MSNIITDATGPETPDGDRGFHGLKVLPKALRIQNDDLSVDVLWRDQSDISSALILGRHEGRIDVPTTAEAGYVLIALDIDGEGFDYVLSEGAPGASLEVLRRAAASLAAAEHSLGAAMGSEMATRTKPECPTWCTISQERHAVEGRDPRGSWYYHVFVIPLDDEVGRVTLSACQTFEEQLRPGESDSPGTMFVEIAADELSLAQAGSLAEALVALVAAATGAQSPS